LRTLCHLLRQRGHDVTVISGDQTSGSALSGFGQESVLDRLEQLHLEKPFDIVHCADQLAHKIAPYKKQLELNLFVDIKSTRVDEVFGLYALTEETIGSHLKTIINGSTRFLSTFFGGDRMLLRQADGVFVTNLQQADILERYYLVPSTKIYRVPFGITVQDHLPSENPQKALEELGIPHGANVFMTVSRFLGTEELRILLRAFQKVVIKKPQSWLVIVGDGPRRFECEHIMLDLALGSKVIFTGNVDDAKIHQYLEGSNLYINLESKSAEFEEPLLEAMAREKGVVASELGLSATIIENGVDGFLIRPSDLASLTRICLETVAGQIDTKSMGQKARRKILKMFDTTHMVDKTLEAYEACLKRKS
jgi:glycosyltransferase involved in cell wall biosynthesis